MSISLTSLAEKMDQQLQKVSYINRYELFKRGKSIKTEISRFVLHRYEAAAFERQLSALGYRDIVCEIGYGNKDPEIITFIATK